MTTEKSVAGRERLELAGDGLLITAGVFALITAIGLAVLKATGDTIGSTQTSATWAAIATSLLTLAGGIAGPVIAWLLHGRRITVAAALGALLGLPFGGAVVMLLIGLSYPLGLIASVFTSSEYAAPIALLALVSTAFAVATVWMVVDAVRDYVPARREHPKLDIARVVSALVLVAFGTLIVVLMTRPGGGEYGEAFIFAYVSGVSGAAIVLGADLAETLWRRSKRAAGANATV